jgi:hypothetical protein
MEPNPEWGDVIMDSDFNMNCYHIPPYPKRNPVIWITNPRSGYFIYMNYWENLFSLMFLAERNIRCVFYHKQYLEKILVNLTLEFIRTYLGYTLLWKSYIHIHEQIFTIYFDDEIEITPILQKDQSTYLEQHITAIREKITK